MQGFAGLILFSVYVLMALGLAIIFGQMGVINMAHGEFMILGAYTVYMISVLVESLAPNLMAYYFPLAIGLAFALAFCAGWLGGVGLDSPPVQAPARYLARHLGPELGPATAVSLGHRPQGGQSHAARVAHGLLGTAEGLDIPINGLFVLGLRPLVTGAVLLALYRSRWGLRVRATVSNRPRPTRSASTPARPTADLRHRLRHRGHRRSGLYHHRFHRANLGLALHRGLVPGGYLRRAASLLGTVASAFAIAQTQSIAEFFMTGSMAKVLTLSPDRGNADDPPQGLFASKVRR
jgi:urea transport system permease protein